MKRRFSDEQIIGMIKEYEAGVKALSFPNGHITSHHVAMPSA